MLARAWIERVVRATGFGPSFPISGYDELNASEVESRLDDLTPAQ